MVVKCFLWNRVLRRLEIGATPGSKEGRAIEYYGRRGKTGFRRDRIAEELREGREDLSR